MLYIDLSSSYTDFIIIEYYIIEVAGGYKSVLLLGLTQFENVLLEWEAIAIPTICACLLDS